MHTQLRLPDDLAKAIDERRQVGDLSRNEWMVRALRWALAQPVKISTRTEKL